MERRRFLVGAGSAALSGSALVGTGAFSRVESHRKVSVAVARDSDAYLGLGKCGSKPNSSYVETDGEGHLVVDMSDTNPTTDEDGTEIGFGVNSDSISCFDNVFQIRNQAKQNIWVWIESTPKQNEDGEDAVRFYWDSRPDTRVDGKENYFDLGPPGSGTCFGIKTVTKGLSEGDELIEDNEVVIHATVNKPDV